MKSFRVALLAAVFLISAVAVATPAVNADTASGCYPSANPGETQIIEKGSKVTCSIGELPGATMTWTSSGFAPSSSTQLRVEFTAKSVGTGWIKSVMEWNGTSSNTYRYQIVSSAGQSDGKLGKLMGYVAKVVSTSDLVCKYLADCGSVARPIGNLAKAITVGSLIAAIPLSAKLALDLKAMRKAVAKHGRSSQQACDAATEAWRTNRNLHRALVSTTPGLDFVFPVPEATVPRCAR